MTEILIDARGHHCPVPTLRLQAAARRASPGDELLLVADDPMARIDAPHFALQSGLDVLSATLEAGVVTVRIRVPL